MLDEFTELIAIDKSTTPPADGDIFVVQPKHNYYYFGKVIMTNIQGLNLNFKGMNLIFMYNYHSARMEAPQQLDQSKLLLAPTVVSASSWKHGYFKTIGNQAVTKAELNVDFGFFDNYDKKDAYYNVEGELLDHIPRFSDFNGLSSFRSIGKEMHSILYGKKYH